VTSVRSLTRLELTRFAGSKGAQATVLTLLLAAFAAPPALAQGGGVTVSYGGGVPAPDAAPTPAPPEPDAAPGADGDSAEATPSPGTSPAPAAPLDTTSSPPPASTPAPADSAASQLAAPRAGQRRPRTSGRRAEQDRARDGRKDGQPHGRARAGRTSPASVFGVSVPIAGPLGRATGTDAESPPLKLIAWALLTLVLAAAALLTLTARLSRIEGLTAPARRDAQWLQRILQAARFAPRGAGGRPVS